MGPTGLLTRITRNVSPVMRAISQGENSHVLRCGPRGLRGAGGGARRSSETTGRHSGSPRAPESPPGERFI